MRTYIATVLITLAALGGTGYGGYRYGADQERAACQLAKADVVLAQHTAAQYVDQQLIVVDKTNYTKLRDLENENATLRASLADGTIRVRVTTTGCVPNGPDASGLDDGTGTADLHPRTAADLAALAGRADREAVKLNALQDWIKNQ